MSAFNKNIQKQNAKELDNIIIKTRVKSDINVGNIRQKFKITILC